jgi:hypothetical protein
MSFDCGLRNSALDALTLTLARTHGHEARAEQDRLENNN